MIPGRRTAGFISQLLRIGCSPETCSVTCSRLILDQAHFRVIRKWALPCMLPVFVSTISLISMMKFLLPLLLVLAACQSNPPVLSESGTSSSSSSSSFLHTSSGSFPAYLETDRHNAYYTRVDGPALRSLDHEPFTINLGTLPAIVRKKTFVFDAFRKAGLVGYGEDVTKDPEGNCPLRKPLSFYKTMYKAYSHAQGVAYSITIDEDGNGEKQYLSLGFWPNLLHETDPAAATFDYWGCEQSEVYTLAINSQWIVFANKCSEWDPAFPECPKINEALKTFALR